MNRSFIAGLCSVTLRSCSVAEVIAVASANELRAIEWGADVHVPPGDRAAAANAARFEAEVISYGSYLLAKTLPTNDEIHRVLDTALSINATNVRIWTPFGSHSKANLHDAVHERVTQICAEAAVRSLAISLEFHGGTMTASAESTGTLLDTIGAPNLFTYWQPSYWGDRTDELDITALGSRLSHLHLYAWDRDGQRFPLDHDERDLSDALRHASRTFTHWQQPRAAFLEFVAADDPDQLACDARTLHRWINEQ